MVSTRLTLRVTKVGMSSLLRLLSATQCGLTIINVVSTRRCARTRYHSGTHPPFFLNMKKETSRDQTVMPLLSLVELMVTTQIYKNQASVEYLSLGLVRLTWKSHFSKFYI